MGSMSEERARAFRVRRGLESPLSEAFSFLSGNVYLSTCNSLTYIFFSYIKHKRRKVAIIKIYMCKMSRKKEILDQW